MMPMIILSVRLEIEIIFKMNYRSFLKNYPAEDTNVDVSHQTLTKRLINGVITEVFDPNIFYSRLSFLESGKDGIDIKAELRAGKAFHGYKLPNIQSKFFTRSALIKNLIPVPAEGKVRAQFSDKNQIIYPKPRLAASPLRAPKAAPSLIPGANINSFQSVEMQSPGWKSGMQQDDSINVYNSNELQTVQRGVAHRLNRYSQDI